mgnify:CR=1 FL=1
MNLVPDNRITVLKDIEHRITISEKTVQEKKYEYKSRSSREAFMIETTDLTSYLTTG